MMLIRGVRSVEIETSDLERSADFYTRIWGLLESARSPNSRYYRGTSAHHHILALHQASGPPCLRRIVFDARNRDDVIQIHERVKATTDQVDPPHPLAWPGGGFGTGFKDIEGRNFSVVCDVQDHAGPNAPVPDRPHKISHVNLNSPKQKDVGKFLVDILGFRFIDETPFLDFFHCENTDHHSVVIAKGTLPTLNHFAFEMPDLDSVMRGAGRMRDHGYPVEWGVGRHGCGNNVYAYFAGPDELPIEYTSEVLQIDESYQPKGPAYWRFPPGRTDQWGVTAPQSARLKRIQDMFSFTSDGHVLS
jgi:catechol 2,3-dioxygenase-like lactoylglutathione lyase family enzyme